MAGGSFKKNAATGKFIKLPDGKPARCTCCGDYALAEPCGEGYEGPDVYFAPGKAPDCAYVRVPDIDPLRCFRVSNSADPHTPSEGDIYVDIGSPGGPTQYETCCECGQACASWVTSRPSLVCPGLFPDRGPCCCLQSGTVVSGTGYWFFQNWTTGLARETIIEVNWDWSYTVGIPGSFTGSYTYHAEVLNYVDGTNPPEFEWDIQDDSGSFSPSDVHTCPLGFQSVPGISGSPRYDCPPTAPGVTQSYVEEGDGCSAYHVRTEYREGEEIYDCPLGGTCGVHEIYEATVTATNPGLPSYCSGGCS